MFKRTKEEIAEYWAERSVFEDPAPSPFKKRHYRHNLKTIGQAFVEEVKEALS